MEQVLIHVGKNVDLVNLKSEVDKLDNDKLENVATTSMNLKNEEDKLDVDKLVLAPVDLSKITDVIKIILWKRCT